mgnify:FL=1|tara:strand:- start:18 stop:488 length:471 start_codon:yes stop_codon:yes gene_type:complete
MELILQELPNELQIKVFDFWTIEDFQKYYFKIKNFKPILDYLIKKKNFKFIGRYDMVLEDIVFQYYQTAYNRTYSDHLLYNGIIEKMYHNQELCIKMWKEKCNKYDYNLPYMPKVLEIVFKENKQNFINGNFKKDYSEDRLTQGLFLSKLITYLNH